MRSLRILAVAAALTPGLAWADSGAVGYGGGSAPANAATVTTVPKILILPFTAVHDTGPGDGWIGKAIEENVLIDLGKHHRFEPMLFSEKNGQGAPGGLYRTVGRTGMVVYGSYQVVEGQVRISAEVVDVNTGGLLGTAKATGAVRDLLLLEDSISDQIREAAAQAPAIAQAAEPAGPAIAAPTTAGEPTYPHQPYAPYTPTYEQQATNYTDYTTPSYYDYGYGYGYPGFYSGYAYYGYPYYYPGYPFYGNCFFYGGFFHHHHHDNDHDGNHHGGNGNWNGNHNWNGNTLAVAHRPNDGHGLPVGTPNSHFQTMSEHAMGPAVHSAPLGVSYNHSGYTPVYSNPSMGHAYSGGGSYSGGHTYSGPGVSHGSYSGGGGASHAGAGGGGYSGGGFSGGGHMGGGGGGGHR